MKKKITLLIVVLLLMAVAFIVGFFIGKSTAISQSGEEWQMTVERFSRTDSSAPENSVIVK